MRKYITIIELILAFIFYVDLSAVAQDYIVDIDGNKYPTIIIGDQIWMAKNLNVTHYSNGEKVHSFCYNHDTSHCNKYGRLYTWNVIAKSFENDSTLDICPENWHVPNDSDWKIFVETLGGINKAGKNLHYGKYAGFNIQWAGNYNPELDVFSFLDRKAYFWTSSSFSNSSAWIRMAGENMKNIARSTVPKQYAFSIRCVKNHE